MQTINPSARKDVIDLRQIARHIDRCAEELQRLRVERRTVHQAMREVRIEALLLLAAAVEQKDNDTGLHVVRMGHFSAAIARAMGQPAQWCKRLLYASRMHDVGKVGIPDAILRKPGPLTADEWAVMKQHPELGATLLSGCDSPLFQMAQEVALHHHEKFDGSGYPHGLKGERIPLAARIVAVADVFDALTSERCYRQAMPDVAVYAHMQEGRDKHFDPAVLTAFFHACVEILELRRAINAGDLHETPGALL